MKNSGIYKGDFSWLELPELPKDNSYLEVFKYVLTNTEFYLYIDEEKSSSVVIKWTKNNTMLCAIPIHRFNPSGVVRELEGILKQITQMEKDLTTPLWYHPLYERLYKLTKITSSYFE